MSCSHFRFLLLTTLTGAAQATWSFNETTHDGPVNATSFYKSSNEVLSMPLRRVEHQGVGTPSLTRRYFGADVLGVYGAAYFAEMIIGTGENPQAVSVLLDTGSFELWVNPNCTASNVQDYCNAFGRYDPSLSPTARNLNTNFGIQYGQGSASGVYYKDDVYLSGAKIQDQQFGVSNTSSQVWFGILGLGHGQGNGVIEYASIIDSLAAQGYTDSKLFSLDLGGQPGPTAAVTGEIVFGGVDTNKYSGNLAKVPTDPSDPHYVVTLNSLSLQTPVSTSSPSEAIAEVSEPITDSNLPLRVVVDSGTTLSLLPESMVSTLAAGFPGATPDGNGGYKVPCDLRNSTDGSVSFEFAGDGSSKVTITVSYSDFIWYGGDECFLGASYSKDIGVWILGDTFLRGAYVTFDQSNDALYMANYAKCSEESNLVAVPAGLDAAANIPGSCAAPAVMRPASPAGLDPDCTETPLPAPVTTTATLNRQASAAPESPDEDCDDDDDNTHQHVAQFSYGHSYEHSYEYSYEYFTATETFMSTMFRHFVYTSSEQEFTTHESFITTFCPGDVVPAPSPAAAPPVTHAELKTTTEPTVVPAPPTVVQATQPATTATAQELRVVTTELCSTSTFTVESCEASDAEACTVGATTTQVVTMVETLSVHAYPPPSSPSSSSLPTPSFPPPASSSPPPPSPTSFSTSTVLPSSASPSPTFFSYSHPLPPPAPQSASAGVAYGGWGFNSSSGGNGVPGVAVAGVAPSRGIIAGAAAVPTKTTATLTGLVVPTSGAAGRGREVVVGGRCLWTVVVVVLAVVI
ncbi:acid protease [Jackrogersella minutella]|nr:acid protease [Jackrogersella minutella]